MLNGEEDRSQIKNKALVTKRFFEILKIALTIPKQRKATKIPRSVIEKRIKSKRNNSMIKQNRKRPEF
jgi:ribosome-associated protein